jgi:tetratricopeptide (TPR) repeat protein
VRQALGPIGAKGVFVGPAINPLTRWLVAEADERLGNLDSAAAGFERMATWSGFDMADMPARGLVEPFAHFRLGRIYTQLGRLDEAKEHYATFLDAFTQPDPEYEWMVTEARTKLEELARGR